MASGNGGHDPVIPNNLHLAPRRRRPQHLHGPALDASFEFLEIQARSRAEHRAWLQILDETMRRNALNPSQNRGAARTEMEINLTASQSYALLQAMAIQKASLRSPLFCSAGRL